MSFRLIIVPIILLIFFVGFIPAVKAAGSSLYFSPASGTFSVGSTFNVSIFVNTNGNSINAVQVDIKFPIDKLQVASPTAGKSFITIWADQPSFSNTAGVISYKGGVPTPGINTSSGLVSTVTFRVKAPGVARLQILESSKVLLNDGQGTNIINSFGQATYELVIPPPEGPKVYSPSHSDINIWYKNNHPVFSWEIEEGIEDFSYSLDDDYNGMPPSESKGIKTSVSFSNVSDGTKYFHIRAKKAGNWGGVTHYSINIDLTPPADFVPKVEPGKTTTNPKPIVSFITTDAMSGLDHYELKVINLTAGSNQTESFFTEQSSPYQLPKLAKGNYEVIVRAFDRAGNYKDGVAKIKILSPTLIYFSSEGLQIGSFLIKWRIVYLILFLISVFILIMVFIFWRRHLILQEDMDRHLEDTERKIREDYEKIRKRLEDDLFLKKKFEEQIDKLERIKEENK